MSLSCDVEPCAVSLTLIVMCSIKKWKCPEGTFVHNFPGHEAIINTLSVNEDGVLFSGGESDAALLFYFGSDAILYR